MATMPTAGTTSTTTPSATEMLFLFIQSNNKRCKCLETEQVKERKEDIPQQQKAMKDARSTDTIAKVLAVIRVGILDPNASTATTTTTPTATPPTTAMPGEKMAKVQAALAPYKTRTQFICWRCHWLRYCWLARLGQCNEGLQSDTLYTPNAGGAFSQPRRQRWLGH